MNSITTAHRSLLKRSRPLLVLGVIGIAGSVSMPAAQAQYQVPDAPLKTLRLAHPRLIATNEDFAAVKKAIETNTTVAGSYAAVQKSADDLLQTAPRPYDANNGKDLLATSRWVKNAALKLGLAYRMTGDRKYADRLWQELESAGNFKDWHPAHFLDVAEMTFAFAIGYDWLYDAWTPDQRAFLRRAIAEKGLQAGMTEYQNGAWWINANHNWNQVCNGGLIVGALAVGDDEPELAAGILRNALKSLPRAMNEFGPDGGWGEGPGYWNFATQYTVYLLASLQSALGTDFGISATPGFDRTGNFPPAVVGPLGTSFNYGDSGSSWNSVPQLFWLASRFNAPQVAGFQLPVSLKQPTPLDIVWGARWMQNPPQFAAPLSAYFRKTEVVTLRSDADSRNATFIGFKGGNNAFNHAHLDLGTFVFDALGQRWAEDFGGDSYSLPRYFGKDRWNYYRLRAEGHNTLVINPGAAPDQDPKATAPITRFGQALGASFAIADLSAAYSSSKASVQRGVRLLGTQVLVQDEITAPNPADVWWFLHTKAAVELNGATATLKLKGWTLTAQILSPADARFEVLDAVPAPSSPNPPGQGTNTAYRKLTVHLPATTKTRLSVLLTPGDKPAANPELTPLDAWR